MRVLVSETPDKSAREILDIPKEELLILLNSDYCLHEVIPMFDNTLPLRVYFDIDSYKGDAKEILETTLVVLNKVFRTTDDCWAICDGSRVGKVSYHIVSKKYKMSLAAQRKLVDKTLIKSVPYIDSSAYWFTMNNPKDEGYLRLPNQSKDTINKEGPPLRILQGEIPDFFITDIENLEEFIIS